jgi:transposase
MRLYAATDLHSNNNVLVIIDEQDHVVHKRRLPNVLSTVLAALEPYKNDLEAIAVESTYNWYWIIDGLMAAGYKVKLVNTSAVKKYDGLKYTDDEDDARHLAHLLRLGILPTGYICPVEARGVRDLLRKRGQLVRCRTAQFLSIQNLASRNTGKGLDVKEIRELNEESILCLFDGSADRALALQSNLSVVCCLDEQIDTLEHTILGRAKLEPAFQKLQTVPGIGKILGLTIMYEAGPMERFPKVGQFASYARCVQSAHWSNGKKKDEGNRKNGNKYLAWAFVEAAHFAVRYNERARRFYQRKKARKNTAVAVKAVAHKLARACYHVLRDQVEFDEERTFA